MNARTIAVGSFLLVALSARALAHGGPPTFEAIVPDPSDPNRLLAPTNFGVLTSRDAGASWTWICPAALALRIDVEDPLVAIAGDGSGLVADMAGLWRASASDCDWTRPDAALTGVRVGALASAGSVVFAGTSEEGAAGSLFRSASSGASFASVYGPTDGAWYESIVIAPSNAMRVYAVQNRPPPDISPWEITVLRSDDGGDGWTPTLFTHVAHEWRVYVLAVDPTNPDRALAKTQNLYPGEHERLVLTENGGANWRDVHTMVQILGAAFSDDGRTAWVGGPVDGLWRSDDGGATFESVYAAQVRCTLVRDGEIWICADDFLDGFAVGRSSDGGASFQPVARLRSITGIHACPAGTPVRDLCPAQQAMLDVILSSAPGDDAGPIDLDAGTDGGALDASVALDGGRTVAPRTCGCRAAGSPAAPGALIMLALLFVRRRIA